MSQQEERRLQLTGGSTYIVSLPKWWINSTGLRKGDVVMLIPQPGGGLLVSPISGAYKERRIGVLEAAPLEEHDDVVRKFLAMYLAGYDAIEVRFKGEMVELRSYLKGVIRRKLIGVEVIEESQDSMVARCLLRYSELPLKSIIERMRILSSLMMQDALRAIIEGDLSLAQDVASRDDDIDRLYFLSIRQLKAAISNPAVAGEIGLRSLREALGYRLISKSLERIADHATSMAQVSPLIGKFPQQLSGELSEFGAISLNVVEDAVRALVSMDERTALRAISLAQDVVKYEERLTKEVFDLGATAIVVAGIKLMLESVRRIAEYGSDIAEVVINMISDRSMEEPSGNRFTPM
ncbi:MAG: PhoU domain-containing protein [Conexivisphaera sp.]|jgi:phosphate uptake regulator